MRIWLALVAITTAMVIAFMHKENMERYVRNGNMTSRDNNRIMQSSLFVDNDDLYLNLSAHKPSMKNEAILTIFTTFKDSYNKSYIYKNTIRNWGLLSPDVIPVLFTDMNESSSIVDYARQRKWHVFQIPQKSKGGIPILRHMFLEAQQLFDTQFYGYANSDILFDRNLTDTIHSLIRLKKKLTNILIVGRRKNWKIKWQQNITELEEIGHYAKSLTLFWTCAEDYFISTHNGYPWSTIPDFVVGRPAYDNWLVITALTRRIPVVDATLTITALHQTDAKGIMEGAKARVETDLNRQLAGRNFSYALAYTTCAHFLTSTNNGSIVMKERKVNGNKCNGQKIPHVRSPFHLS